MFPKNCFELRAKDNKRMDAKIYEVCEKIPDETRKNMGAFFKPIDSTLNHIHYGDLAWIERLRDNKFTPRQISEDLFEEFNDLRIAQEEIDLEIPEWVRTLTPEIQNQTFDYVSNVGNFNRKLPIWVLTTHMLNYQPITEDRLLH